MLTQEALGDRTFATLQEGMQCVRDAAAREGTRVWRAQYSSTPRARVVFQCSFSKTEVACPLRITVVQGSEAFHIFVDGQHS